MYCSLCGNEIPDQSTFCLHCGNRIAASHDQIVGKPQEPIEWEYKDFEIEFPPGSRGKVYIGPRGYTIPEGRLHFWQATQAGIMKQVHTWLDEGWKPVSEVGPACFQVRTYTRLVV